MNLKVLIVEDQFLEARSLSIMLKNAGHETEGIAKSVDQALELITGRTPDIVLVDIFLQGDRNGIDLARILDRRNIPFIYLSANSNTSVLEQAIGTRPYGFLVKPFREREILIALDIAVYRYQKNREFVSRQHNWLSGLLRNILQTEGSRMEKSLSLIRALTSFLPFDRIIIDAGPDNTARSATFSFQRIGFDEYVQLEHQDTLAQKDEKPYFHNGEQPSDKSADDPGRKIPARTKGPRSKLWMPISHRRGVIMSIAFYNSGDEQYTSDHLDLLVSVTEDLSAVLEYIRQSSLHTGTAINAPARKAPNQLLKPKIEGIIGKSPGLLEALDKVTQVAPFDNTVLILGETGVGKEGLVKAIHQLSARKSKPLIKLNCAAIPVNLVESELFGHEKGAFTGALERRIGKFEQANGGTLFLDEIGELPLEVQSKLLRTLQEKEIERVGGRTTIHTDVRIITATNRDLPREIGEGRFRLDLYYRINVFPIQLPPLRQRREDIPELAAYFLQMYGAQMSREDIAISSSAMRQLQDYSWPGNIRELQHLIERHVLVCRSGAIDSFEMPEPIPTGPAGFTSEPEIRAFADMDRHHILQALKKTNGKIAGRGGAAELLRLPPTTLSSKIKRLGIKWPPENN
jgi:transcriptional regulator with GAF, ATPase, and Fis domain